LAVLGLFLASPEDIFLTSSDNRLIETAERRGPRRTSLEGRRPLAMSIYRQRSPERDFTPNSGRFFNLDVDSPSYAFH
jgi:hypothetical protein